MNRGAQKPESDSTGLPTRIVRCACCLRFWVGLATVPLLVVLGLVSIHFSPFGIDNRLASYSQDIFNQLAGKFQLIYRNKGQKQISVLLLNDKSLEQFFAGRWPISYADHGRILNNLLLYEPRAVVIDFLWLNPQKPGIDYLLRVLERYRDAEIPVYLAFRQQDELKTFWPELQGLVRPFSPRLAVDPNDFVARNYPLSHAGLPSSAVAAYRDLIDPEFVAAETPNLQIFWGVRSNPHNLSWMDAGDIPQGSLGLLFDGPKVHYSPPYTTTVLVRDLLNPLDIDDQTAHQALQERLQGQVVFFGGNIAGVSDLIYTPTRQIRPGVYYHAMALDNLISFGGGFKTDRMKPSIKDQTIINDLIVQILILIVPSFAIYWQWLRRSRTLQIVATSKPPSLVAAEDCRFGFRPVVLPTHWRRRVRPFFMVIGLRLVLLSWISFCGAIGFFCLELTPRNWMGYFAFAEIGFFLSRIFGYENIVGTGGGAP